MKKREMLTSSRSTADNSYSSPPLKGGGREVTMILLSPENTAEQGKMSEKVLYKKHTLNI